MPTYGGNYTYVSKPSTPTYDYVAKEDTIDRSDVPKPYTEPLAILTEDGIEILYESEIVMTVQGTL